MRLIDLSHPLTDGGPAFPGDPKPVFRPFTHVATHHYNLTQVQMGTHTGTHLDAMFHFFDDGRTIDQMPLDWFYGPARVLPVPKPPGAEITAADLGVHESHLTPGARILLNSGWHRRYGSPEFFEESPSLTLEAAHYLVSRKIRLLGMDLPTPGKDWLELHHVFLAADAEVVLVESLANLDTLPETFTFIGFPLNFQGRDGSPIRAVALCP